MLYEYTSLHDYRHCAFIARPEYRTEFFIDQFYVLIRCHKTGAIMAGVVARVIDVQKGTRFDSHKGQGLPLHTPEKNARSSTCSYVTFT